MVSVVCRFPCSGTTITATATLPHGATALERAFREAPAMEAERVAAHGTEPVMPCVRLSAPDFDAVDEALAGDPSVSVSSSPTSSPTRSSGARA